MLGPFEQVCDFVERAEKKSKACRMVESSLNWIASKPFKQFVQLLFNFYPKPLIYHCLSRRHNVSLNTGYNVHRGVVGVDAFLFVIHRSHQPRHIPKHEHECHFQVSENNADKTSQT